MDDGIGQASGLREALCASILTSGFHGVKAFAAHWSTPTALMKRFPRHGGTAQTPTGESLT